MKNIIQTTYLWGKSWVSYCYLRAMRQLPTWTQRPLYLPTFSLSWWNIWGIIPQNKKDYLIHCLRCWKYEQHGTCSGEYSLWWSISEVLVSISVWCRTSRNVCGRKGLQVGIQKDLEFSWSVPGIHIELPADLPIDSTSYRFNLPTLSCWKRPAGNLLEDKQHPSHILNLYSYILARKGTWNQ